MVRTRTITESYLRELELEALEASQQETPEEEGTHAGDDDGKGSSSIGVANEEAAEEEEARAAESDHPQQEAHQLSVCRSVRGGAVGCRQEGGGGSTQPHSRPCELDGTKEHQLPSKKPRNNEGQQHLSRYNPDNSTAYNLILMMRECDEKDEALESERAKHKATSRELAFMSDKFTSCTAELWGQLQKCQAELHKCQAELREARSSDPELQTVCVYCRVQRPTIMLTPCSHVVFCNDCWTSHYLSKSIDTWKCPLCNNTSKIGYTHVYLG